MLTEFQSSYSLTISAGPRTFVSLRSQVLEIGSDGSQTLLAGVGLTGPRGDGGPARTALVGTIRGLTAGPGGEIFYADSEFRRIRKIRSDNVLKQLQEVISNGNNSFL